jgi:hypothetical protein
VGVEPPERDRTDAHAVQLGDLFHDIPSQRHSLPDRPR